MINKSDYQPYERKISLNPFFIFIQQCSKHIITLILISQQKSNCEFGESPINNFHCSVFLKLRLFLFIFCYVYYQRQSVDISASGNICKVTQCIRYRIGGFGRFSRINIFVPANHAMSPKTAAIQENVNFMYNEN